MAIVRSIAGWLLLWTVCLGCTLGQKQAPEQRSHPAFLASPGVEATSSPARLQASQVTVPAGEFLMGDLDGRSDEHPVRLVSLDTFCIDRLEVTNRQYSRYLQARLGQMDCSRQNCPTRPRYWFGDSFPEGMANLPVVGISWEDAAGYCAWVNERLPTEAEWEKACRGQDGRIFPWGNNWEVGRLNIDPFPQEEVDSARDAGWLLLAQTPILAPGSSARGLRAVGSYPQGASPYGVLDLEGNASEWVDDWYNWGGYENLPGRNPRMSGPQWNHSVRGSAWYDPNSSMEWVRFTSRCSARSSSHATEDPRIGFRCASHP